MANRKVVKTENNELIIVSNCNSIKKSRFDNGCKPYEDSTYSIICLFDSSRETIFASKSEAERNYVLEELSNALLIAGNILISICELASKYRNSEADKLDAKAEKLKNKANKLRSKTS